MVCRPPKGRGRYKEMAAAAYKLADGAPSKEFRAGNIGLAASWHSLADEIERGTLEHMPHSVRGILEGEQAE